MPFSELFTDTAGFLSSNLIINGFGRALAGPHEKSGLFEAKVRCYEDGATRMQDNKKIPRYAFEAVDNYNGTLESVKIYYCHYSSDEFHMLVVEDSADLMLTPTMDGCSFGVGSATASKARLVGHVNVNRETGGKTEFNSAIATQDAIINSALPGASVMSGQEYRAFGTTEAGTTIGIRDRVAGGWSFYTQFWNRPERTTNYFLRNPSYRKFA